MVFLSLIILGCGSSKETTTTTTRFEAVPAVFVIDTQYIVIPAVFDDSQADSIGRAYLEKYCKGSAEIDKDGLKATISFYIKKASQLQSALSEKHNLVIQLNTELEKKKQEIKSIVTTTEKKTEPSALWVWWASMKYWVSTLLIGILLGFITGWFVRSKFSII